MKKLFLLILLTVLLTTSVSPGLAADSSEASRCYSEHIRVSLPTDAVLTLDTVMNNDFAGHRRIQSWQRVIDGVIHVQNDYVRIDVDVDTNEIILYEKQWRDIKFEFESVDIEPFEPPGGDYIWKKVALFVDEQDRGSLGDFFKGSPLEGLPLYDFFDEDEVEYPLVCWEVRYTDGTTVLYDLDGTRIGQSTIAAPSPKGYLASGTCSVWLHEQAWKVARANANYWYSQWTDSTTSVWDPRPGDPAKAISTYVSNQSYKFYYAIGHGDEFGYWGLDKPGRREDYYIYYNQSQAYADMLHRGPMRFALMVHCDSMSNYTEGTFSHAFRKGGTVGTVTVGFSGLLNATPWENLVVFFWQNEMLSHMTAGYTIRQAYDKATLRWHWIAKYVRFVGDQHMRVVGPSGVKGYVGLYIPGWGAFPFAGAKVAVHETGEYVFTNSHGYYEILLPPGSHTLTASYPTFYDTTQTAEVFPATFTERHFVLEPMWPGMPIPVVVPGDGLVEAGVL